MAETSSSIPLCTTNKGCYSVQTSTRELYVQFGKKDCGGFLQMCECVAVAGALVLLASLGGLVL